MATVLSSLVKWAENLPLWEKAALEQIISGRPFADSDYDLLIKYLLEEKGLIEKATVEPDFLYLKDEIRETNDSQKSVKLVSIANLTNVNALADNQRLTFHDQLTVVFGANGSGKSGYARVIGAAGFTRGDKEIFPNVMLPAAESQAQTADIEVEIGSENKTLNYKIGELCPELGSFYVFDSKSVEMHITKFNKISFSPSGLNYLTRLSNIHDECSQKLTTEAAKIPEPHSFGELFPAHSEVRTLIANLGLATDVKMLKRLANLSAVEDARIRDLDLEIAELKANNSSVKITNLRQTVGDLIGLSKNLKIIEDELNEVKVEAVKTEIVGAKRLQQLARKASVSEFQDADFNQTGTPAWLEFLKSAKKLSELENSEHAHSFSKGNRCLLCRQNLNIEASDLLEKLWHFLEDESQEKLESVRRQIQRECSRINQLNLDCINEQNVSRRYLENNHSEIMRKVSEFIDAAKRNRATIFQAIETLEPSAAGEVLPDSAIEKIQTLVVLLQNELSELEQSNPQNKINELSYELTALEHRVTLRENLDEILRYVEKIKWTEKARKAIGTTKHITVKYNELFKELVTEKYVKLFESILADLNCPLKIEIETKAQKGETLRHIVLKAENSGKSSQIEKVLSEGEKRAVALADFLTEIVLDERSCGIILDDPITSLDWDWKETVAEKLVAEAASRQVIVFTHDLHFLYLLKKHAEKKEIDLEAHQIRKEGENQPGYVYLNCSPVAEQELHKTDEAEKLWKKAAEAKNLNEKLYFLQQGFGSLRAAYESLVVNKIFGKVVTRFEERVSIGRLKDVVVDAGVLNQIMEKYELISRYIGSHLPSDYSQAQKPTTEMLKREIDDYNSLKSSIKKMHSERAKTKLLVDL